jgi:LysM domain
MGQSLPWVKSDLTWVILSCYHEGMNNAQALAALTPGFDPYAGHSDTGSFFSHIGHAISSAAKGIGKGVSRVVHDATHPKDLAKDSFSVAKYSYKNVVVPAVAKGLPIVQTVLKNAGPMGMVASGAISAMRAGLSGKNLESIAWAAAEGAAPTGIDKAIGAAEALRHGSNVLKTAIDAGVTHFIPGSPEHLGYESAISVLKTAANKVALGVARRALPTEGAKRAFDAAVGTVSTVVNAHPQALLQRAGSIRNFSMGRAKGVISAFQPNLKNAIDSLKRNPSLMTQHPMVLAQQFGTTTQTVLSAMRHVGQTRLLPWRSLTPNAANFVRRYHPHAPMSALTHGTADTAGLTEDGIQYVVVAGDSPWAIAQKLSGNGNNWTQLKALNTDKKPTIDKNVWTGEVLNIPPSWQKPTAKVALPPAALPSQPAPQAPTIPVITAPPSISIVPSILQGKSILVAWSKTDGVNQAGLPDYGLQAADLSTTMGPRDSLEMQSFQNWDNKTGNAGLPVNGQLDAATLAALQSWAETRAAQAIPGASIPGANQTITLPPMVISGEPNLGLPNPLALPPPGVPALSSGASPLPAVAANPPASGTTPKKSMAPALAGAAIGGVIFGLPGAIIGGVAGAAIG